MNRKHIFSLLAATLLTATVSLLTACGSDDDDTTVPHITPEATGEFTDNRDGTTYHYVTYGGLDWTVENARYDTGNDDTRSIYLSNDAIGDEEGTAAQQTVGTYGYLYSWQGAQEAVPDGWRLPTDDDWKKLEMALGMAPERWYRPRHALWRIHGRAVYFLRLEILLSPSHGILLDSNTW